MLETIDTAKIFDARTLPCETKQAEVFARARALAADDHFVLVNTHNPVPLRYLLEAAHPGQFTWEYLKQEPGSFAVRIGRKSQ